MAVVVFSIIGARTLGVSPSVMAGAMTVISLASFKNSVYHLVIGVKNPTFFS